MHGVEWVWNAKSGVGIKWGGVGIKRKKWSGYKMGGVGIKKSSGVSMGVG